MKAISRLTAALRRLFARMFPPRMGQIHYINGPDTLPTPLTYEEEKAAIERLPHDDAAHDQEGLCPDFAPVPCPNHSGVAGTLAQTSPGEQQEAAVHGVEEQEQIAQHQPSAGDGLAGVFVHNAQTEDTLADAPSAQQIIPAQKCCESAHDHESPHNAEGLAGQRQSHCQSTGQAHAKSHVHDPRQ